MGETHADASTSDREDRDKGKMRPCSAQDIVVGVAGVAIGVIAGFVMGRRAARGGGDDEPGRGDGGGDEPVVVDDSTSIDSIDRLRTALMDAQTMAQDADRRREYAERALASARNVAANAGPARVAESAPVTPQKKRSRTNDSEHVEFLSPWAHKPRFVMNDPTALVALAKAGRSVSRSRLISRRSAFADEHTDDDDDDDDDDVPITRRQYSQSVPQSPSKTPLEQ